VNVWFDGYKFEKTLIIDEFYGWLKWDTILRILDGHPYNPEVKGSTTVAAWDKVIITSNKGPDSWYNKDIVKDQSALARRIHRVVYIDQNLYGPATPPVPPPAFAAFDGMPPAPNFPIFNARHDNILSTANLVDHDMDYPPADWNRDDHSVTSNFDHDDRMQHFIDDEPVDVTLGYDTEDDTTAQQLGLK